MASRRVSWLACATLVAGLQNVWAQPPLRQYDSAHYVIHTDLDPDSVREATIRLTKMCHEYTRRTSAFNIRINQKLPISMFSKHADYMAAGGPPGSAGVFTGDRLMATMGPVAQAFSWSTVQHEGFHQFVDRRGRIHRRRLCDRPGATAATGPDQSRNRKGAASTAGGHDADESLAVEPKVEQREL